MSILLIQNVFYTNGIEREGENRFNIPFRYGSIPLLDENVRFMSAVLPKPSNWSPTHRLLVLLYIYPVQQLFSRQRCPHRIELTSSRSNIATVKFPKTKVLRLEYTAMLFDSKR